ncbi:retinol dehydrogenase 13-like [Daphnia pulicaria]|uniref:retinol dehydrogenase 13-like n=1 Tax=Daphnia pulicaria TaxID=35523 RepID=UPI001EECD0AD|nr:retinol dehydrogenase 13-like [Daphnia pulicaria]
MKIPAPYLWFSAVGAFGGGIILVKEYFSGTRYEGKEKLDGKTVIITGATDGIGKETAKDLAKRGAKVYMASRDIKKCEEIRKEFVLESGNKFIYCRKCDLASQESIRQFASRFNSEESKLHILINNAGVMRCPRSLTAEGIEMQIGVNHFGHFLLTHLLLDKLKQSAPSRVINVSSVAHLRGKIDFDDLNSEKKYDPAAAYEQSKLANVLFTRELAKRLEGTGVTVNALHPGIVNTNISRHMGFVNSWFASIILKPLSWPFIRTPPRGAQTTLYAALDPSLEKITGKYFSNCAEAEVAPHALDDDVARKLFLTSLRWTRLN